MGQARTLALLSRICLHRGSPLGYLKALGDPEGQNTTFCLRFSVTVCSLTHDGRDLQVAYEKMSLKPLRLCEHMLWGLGSSEQPDVADQNPELKLFRDLPLPDYTWGHHQTGP